MCVCVLALWSRGQIWSGNIYDNFTDSSSFAIFYWSYLYPRNLFCVWNYARLSWSAANYKSSFTTWLKNHIKRYKYGFWLETCLFSQGYAAREFAKQGVKPGELAIISKEAVCTWIDLPTIVVLLQMLIWLLVKLLLRYGYPWPLTWQNFAIICCQTSEPRISWSYARLFQLIVWRWKWWKFILFMKCCFISFHESNSR